MAPCPKCGANLAFGDIVECPFDPMTNAIQCQQCGNIFPIDEEGTLVMQDVDDFLQSRQEEEFHPMYAAVSKACRRSV